MIDAILGFEFTSLLGLLLYWLPLLLCLYGYTARTWLNYRRDVAAREEAAIRQPAQAHVYANYQPTDTVGTLIGRALITVIPVANLIAGVFSVAPEVFGRFFTWIGRVFDRPLVPARKAEEGGR